MSVVSPQPGEVFRVTVRKALANNPSATWVNTYEIAADAAGLPDGAFENSEALRGTALTILQWERSFHLVDVLFTRLTVSTWLDDSVPYNGDEFLASSIIESGTRIPSGEPLGLQNCLYIERQPLTGRTGKIYFRRCLGEGDVSADSGQTNLEEALRTSLQASLTASGESTNLLQILSVDHGAFLVMANRNAANDVIVRRVFGLSVSDRVVNKKTDNRWFNRTV